jgi:hypothetical protein
MDLRQTRPGRERFGLGEPHDLEAVLAFCLGYGNLVTTAWWDDIWLKEAFATWLETKIVDTAYPEWRESASQTIKRVAISADRLGSARLFQGCARHPHVREPHRP